MACCCGCVGCRYYNWRQDTLSDLLVVTAVSLLLLCSAAVAKHTWWYASSGHGPCTATERTVSKPYSTASVTPAPAVSCTACGTAAELGFAAAAAVGGTPAAGFCNSMLASSSNVVEGPTTYTASLWDDLYTVLILSFGESFPPAHGESGLSDAAGASSLVARHDRTDSMPCTTALADVPGLQFQQPCVVCCFLQSRTLLREPSASWWRLLAWQALRWPWPWWNRLCWRQTWQMSAEDQGCTSPTM